MAAEVFMYMTRRRDRGVAAEREGGKEKEREMCEAYDVLETGA